MKKIRVIKVLYIAVILLASQGLYAMTVPQIIAELHSHMDSIQSLKGDLSIKTSGTGKVIAQQGHLEYKKGEGTVFKLEGSTPLEVRITARGTVIVNGQQQQGTHTSGQMGDIFFLNLVNSYKLRIVSEQGDNVTLAGYNPEEKLSLKKLLTAVYDKRKKVITSIDYKGDVADYPYRMKISYQTIQGIPVVKNISTFTSAFSVTITSTAVLENVTLVVVEEE